MRVAGSLVMDSQVSTHSFVYKVVLPIGAHKGKLLFTGQFTGQSCLDLTDKLAVPCFLDLLHTVPEDRTVCKFRRGVGRQHDLRMNNAAFPLKQLSKRVSSQTTVSRADVVAVLTATVDNLLERCV